MKSSHFIKLFTKLITGYCFFTLSNQLSAQAFLNGSFETNTAAACDYNMVNATFTSKMANATAYGVGNELDIMQSTCPYGPSQHLTWFVGLAAPSGNTDAFTMNLSAPLVSGTTYKMSFWDKGDIVCCSPGMPVIIGVSTVAGASGTTVYTGPTPTGGVWNQRCFTFVAPNNGQYISVRTAGPTRWTHVDNFVMNSTCTVLPIELIRFNVICRDNTFVLKWATATEKNNKYFGIEYSQDGTDFEEIGTVAGSGNSNKILNYEFIDARLQNDVSYFRLKQTDFDNTSTFSHIVAIQKCKDASEFKFDLYPNPASGTEVICKIEGEGYTLELFDVLGEKVSANQLNYGENRIAIDRLPNGTYTAKFIYDNAVVIVQKLVISK